MVDFIAVTALVVSIVVGVFVVVREGFGLTLEYRESEATSKRKRDVDEKLKQDLKGRQKQYLEMESAQGNSETQIVHLEELGRCAFLTRSMTSTMLDNMTRYIKDGLRNLVAVMVMLALAILFMLFGDFSYISGQAGSGYVVVFISLILLAGFGYAAYKDFGKHLKLREAFIRLSENPSLQSSVQLFNELRAAGLF